MKCRAGRHRVSRAAGRWGPARPPGPPAAATAAAPPRPGPAAASWSPGAAGGSCCSTALPSPLLRGWECISGLMKVTLLPPACPLSYLGKEELRAGGLGRGGRSRSALPAKTNKRILPAQRSKRSEQARRSGWVSAGLLVFHFPDDLLQWVGPVFAAQMGKLRPRCWQCRCLGPFPEGQGQGRG